MLKHLEECSEEVNGVLHVMRTSRLPDRVHRKHSTTDVHSPDTQLRQQRTNGRPTRPEPTLSVSTHKIENCENGHIHIVAHFVFLNLSTFPFHELLYQETTDGITCIALLRVCLDNNAAIDLGCVVVFVFLCVIGVDGMGHITTKEERASD